jgi:uncharacterized protein (TIGR03435 family)
MKIAARSRFWLSAICTITALIGADRPRFEAASVKRTDQCGVGKSIDPTIVRLDGVPLRPILAEAFGVKMDQVVGASWLDSDCFAIVAKLPEGATREQVPAMLQALLVERFHLAVHRESHTSPGYALMIDKNGVKFRESDLNSPNVGQVRFVAGPGASGLKGPVSMAFLAHSISLRLHSPVEDLTGLKGKYDIDVTWVPDRTMEPLGPYAEDYAANHPGSTDAAASVRSGADIFTALR